MIQAVSRFIFVTGGLLGGYAVTRLVDWQNELGLPRYYVIFLLIILGGAIGYVLGGIIGRELTHVWLRAEQRIRETAPADILLGTVGLVVGLLVGLLVSTPLRLIKPEWLAITATVLLMLTVAYLTVSVALTKRRDFSAMFPRLAPAELISADERGVLLDTSAVIDGRFVELHDLGFMPGTLRVPRFVLAELQTRVVREAVGASICSRAFPPTSRSASSRPTTPIRRSSTRSCFASRSTARAHWSPWTTTSRRSPGCVESTCSTSTRRQRP
jgi:uncharacterized protein YacL